MWCSSKRRVGSLYSHLITVDQSLISPSSSLHNLSDILWYYLIMVDQIRTLTRSCYYNLRQLRFIRASLSHLAMLDAAYALVLSQLDYCNVLYAGSPEYVVKTLQIVINTAARVVVVVGHSCFSPISGYVHDVLHCLPAAQRIDFKVAILASKVLNCNGNCYKSTFHSNKLQ